MSLERRVEKLTSILDIAKAMTVERDLDRLLALILEEATRVVEADRCSLFLLDADRGELWSKIAQGMEKKEIRFPVGQGIAGHVAATGEPIIIDDAYEDPRFNPAFDKKSGYRTRNILCVPMLRRDASGGDGIEISGVIQALNKTSGDFSVEDQELLIALGGQAAAAWENATLHKEIRTLFEGFIKASVVAIESRDPTTSGHSERVATLTVELAEMVERDDTGPHREVVFKPEELREIRYASLLHDFGKVGVREHVLVKAKKLQPHELLLIGNRFQLARRGFETELLRRKIELMQQGAGQSDLERIDAELSQKLEEIDGFWEFVQRCNEPTPLEAEVPAELARVAQTLFPSVDGDERLLSEAEQLCLTIPRGTLTQEERREIESHVEHTWRFLSTIPWTRDLRQVPRIAYAHHEKLTGDGYPRRLKAEEIPVQSRMMTICDIYDALTASDRPYMKAFSHDRALDVLGMESKAGRLDNHLLRVFIEANVPAVLRRPA